MLRSYATIDSLYPNTEKQKQFSADLVKDMQVGISIVVPVYSGEQYLEKLMSEIISVKNDLNEKAAPVAITEVIFVDDAAIDGSPPIIDKLAAEHDWVVALHLSRNFGQHAATSAGILHSAGYWVVTMDEDLQHPPDFILSLLQVAVANEHDLVYANATSGVHKSVLRDWGSKGFKRIMQKLTDCPHIENFNSFRLIRGSIARAAASVSNHDTYLDISLSWFSQRVGVKITDLTDTRYISTGRSGYSFRSLLSHAWRMLFSSQIKILRIGAVFGFAVLGLAIAGSVYFLGLNLFRPEDIKAQGWTSLFLGMSFFGGLSALLSGIMLQYLSTLVLQAHGKPRFFVVDRSKDAELRKWFASKDS